MLQQMLVEDKCDQVRSACCKSLAMVVNEIDDESRLSPVRNHSIIIDFSQYFHSFFFSALNFSIDVCQIHPMLFNQRNVIFFLQLQCGV